MQIVVVIPTYNEAKNISVLIPELEKTFNIFPHHDFSILVVDGNSTDSTGAVVSELSEDYPNVHLLLEEKKAGLGAAYVYGFKFAMKTLAGGRIGIASQALGIASGAYELALQYSKERKAFGKEISKHQAIAFKLADMATQIEAARHLCIKAAWEKDQKLNYDLSGAMAKLYAADMAMAVTIEAVQIHGGYGFVKEYHVERLMRDAKITQIYEGTSEIQKIVISRSILRD